jgi:hypothetical protein
MPHHDAGPAIIDFAQRTAMLTLNARGFVALFGEVATVVVNHATDAGCLFGEPPPVLSRHAIVVEEGSGHEAGHVPNLAATREGKSRGLSGFAFQIAGKSLDYVDKVPRVFLAIKVPREGVKVIRRQIVKDSRSEIHRADLFKNVATMNRDAVHHLRNVLPYVWQSVRGGPKELREATAHDHDVKIFPPSAEDEAGPFPPEPLSRSESCPVGGSAANALVTVAIRESLERGRLDPVLFFPIGTHPSQ